jgi:copper(I)-binding protein
MTHRAGAAALATALLAITACGGDESGSGPVTDAWTRPTPSGATTAAVYLAIDSDEDDVLTGASVNSAVAGGAELHTTQFLGDPDATVPADDLATGSGDVVMHAVEEIEVPGGERVQLDPGSQHVMLVDLAFPLDNGERFDLTLQFAEAGEQVVRVDVQDSPP